MAKIKDYLLDHPNESAWFTTKVSYDGQRWTDKLENVPVVKTKPLLSREQWKIEEKNNWAHDTLVEDTLSLSIY